MSKNTKTHIELALKFLYNELLGQSLISFSQPWHCQIQTSLISSSALAQILSVLLSDLPFTFSDTMGPDITKSIIYTDEKLRKDMIASVILMPESAITKDFKISKETIKVEESFTGIDGTETYLYLWVSEKQLQETSNKIHSENIVVQLTRPDIFPSTNTSNNPVPLYMISFTSEALYSATPLKANELMTVDIIQRLKGISFNREPIMLDGTANCGADTIGCLYNSVRLKRSFQMISVELNELNCKSLKSNIVLFGYENRVNIICGNVLYWLGNRKQPIDILYFDPPWGGKDYKHEQEVRLKLDDKSIWNISSDILKDKNLNAKLIVVKAPFNFDKNEESFQAIKNRCEVKSYPISKNIVYIFIQ